MSQPLRILSLILPLLVPCTLRAEVLIPPACRVKNRPPGRCGWCALETLARHLGLQAMYGLTDKHPSPCSPQSLEDCLRTADISYRIQYPGRHSEDILRYAIQADLGAAVGLRGPYPGAEKHIVTLIDFESDVVKLIDPNDADGRIRQVSLSRFRRLWDGFALVLESGTVWARRKPGRGESGRTTPVAYGSSSEARLSPLPRIDRNDSPPEPWRRNTWALRTPFCTTSSHFPMRMRRD